MEYSLKVVNLAAGTVSETFEEAKQVLKEMSNQDPNFRFTDIGEVFIHIELDDNETQQILWFCGPTTDAGYTPATQLNALIHVERLMEYCMGKWDEGPIEYDDGLIDGFGRTYVATETKQELLDILQEFYEHTPTNTSGCMSVAVIDVDGVSFEAN